MIRHQSRPTNFAFRSSTQFTTTNLRVGNAKLGTPLQPQDVERIASELAGKNLKHLFDAYVSGTSIMESALVHGRLGLKQELIESAGTQKTVLIRDPEATPEARVLRRTVLGLE